MNSLRTSIVLMAGWLTAATAVSGQPVIEFNPAAYTTGENAGAVLLTIQRSGDINSPASVDFATADGTATAGVKYTATNGTVAFAAGETRQTISIALLNDALMGGPTSFKVFLSNPTGGAILNTTTNATVTVLDPDKGISFRFSAYSFPEDVSAAVIGISRGDQGDQPISVDLDTSDGTALEGRDYAGFRQTVVLPADKRPYFFSIPILNNQIKGGNRTFRVTMSNPVDGMLGCTPVATVTILDNDPGFEFEAASYAVAEDGGSVLIGVRRGTDDTSLPVSVDYATSDVTALAGTDYTSTSGTLAFYDPATPMPLVFLFHGLNDSGQGVESYMQFRPLAESRGFLYCYPDGSLVYGFRAWNSTDYASDPSADWGAPIADDAGWVRDLVEETARRFAVDRKRIYMVGRSAGAHMPWRMGGQYADLVAGISPHANGGFWDASLFVPSEPVHVLYLQSVLDNYWGGLLTECDGLFFNPIARPGTERTLRDWANYNGASNPVTDPEPTKDLIYDVPGPDTLVTRYANHPPGGAVEL